jgi:inner membrane transporter RhtA
MGQVSARDVPLLTRERGEPRVDGGLGHHAPVAPTVDAAAPERAVHVPAPAWILLGAVSTQAGAALAVSAFDRIGPVGIAWGRIAFGALALVVLMRILRLPLRSSREAWRLAAIFGVALAVMNTSFYLGIERVPLGPAVTIEFWGPIAVAVITSHRRLDLLWAALALFGVGLLGGGLADVSGAGVGFVLLAGGAWAVYIVVGRRVANVWTGASGLTAAMLVATVVLAPLGLALSGGELASLDAIALCLGVGILASAVPYGLDQIAMRRVPARTFSVLLSLHPAVAAAVGAIALDQGLSLRDVVAIAAVVCAAAGAMRSLAPAPEVV